MSNAQLLNPAETAGIDALKVWRTFFFSVLLCRVLFVTLPAAPAIGHSQAKCNKAFAFRQEFADLVRCIRSGISISEMNRCLRQRAFL